MGNRRKIFLIGDVAVSEGWPLFPVVLGGVGLLLRVVPKKEEEKCV